MAEALRSAREVCAEVGIKVIRPGRRSATNDLETCAELTSAEAAYHTAQRKAIYEEMHPETSHGAAGVSRQIGDTHVRSAIDRFTSSSAKATGRSERTIQRDAARGEALADTMPRIIGTSLDKGVEIDALVKMQPREREEIITRAERGESISALAIAASRGLVAPGPTSLVEKWETPTSPTCRR